MLHVSMSLVGLGSFLPFHGDNLEGLKTMTLSAPVGSLQGSLLPELQSRRSLMLLLGRWQA